MQLDKVLVQPALKEDPANMTAQRLSREAFHFPLGTPGQPTHLPGDIPTTYTASEQMYNLGRDFFNKLAKGDDTLTFTELDEYKQAQQQTLKDGGTVPAEELKAVEDLDLTYVFGQMKHSNFLDDLLQQPAHINWSDIEDESLHHKDHGFLGLF